MLTLVETIIFTILLVLTVYGFIQPLRHRYRLVRLGRDEDRFNHPWQRFFAAVTSFFFLRCSVKRERVFTGFVHFFILYGSLTFDTVSINHILSGYKEGLNLFGHGGLRAIHSFVADFLAIAVLLAVLYFIVRRFIVKPRSYTYPSLESVLIYTLLITVTVTFLLYEAAAIGEHPEHAHAAFLSSALSGWLFPADQVEAIHTWVTLFWWLHILNVFLFILYVPRSKYMHMFVGPINIAFKSDDPSGLMQPIDIENAESFGITAHTDLSWKDLLDGYACIDCGRCDDYCPAYNTDKPLSPKKIILNMRDSLMAEGKSVLKDSEYTMTPLMEGTYSAEEIWSCTSCGACMYVCPVKNEHLSKILGLRQSQVLMESKFPSELNLFFKNMENNSNPWGFGSSTRADWAEPLKVPTLAEKRNVDLLYWVGCAGSFDARGKNVTEAMVKILNKSGVNYGILGSEENCCGDQARRIGNEYLFQMMAQQNIEIFQKYGVKKILVTCPHGYNTFKNEYPSVARMAGIDKWEIEVVHHSQFLNELIDSGRLSASTAGISSLTFHDPCYLGRHNQQTEPARGVLKETTGVVLKEMAHSRMHSFCCGAGGGLMWTEENLGSRVNHKRTEEVLQTGVKTVCTACPFCMTMLEDGIKDSECDNDVQVRDISEIVAQGLDES